MESEFLKISKRFKSSLLNMWTYNFIVNYDIETV